MNAYSTARRLRRGLGAFAMLATLPAAACTSVDNVLEVTDPDIINPGDVGSAAGANAVRLGALSRFIGATSGNNGGSSGETLWMYTGLFTDEYRSGDTFNQRDQTDKRAVTYENANIENGYTYAHRARVSAIQAIAALEEYAPNTPPAQIAELYLVQAYVENMLAEAFCSGVPFSVVTDGQEQYGEQMNTTETFERALAHADSGLALITGTTAADLRVRHALAVVKGRILLNLDRYADAAQAVAAVPASFSYEHEHSQTTRDNDAWALNVSGRRYTVSDGEGANGIDFAGAGDPRLPVCTGGDAACLAHGITNTKPFDSNLPITQRYQLKWPTRDASSAVVDGIEAKLIIAEAQLAGAATGSALATLNELRGTVDGLAPLATASVDVLFRERAFWLYGTGHRLGDLRRLVRQYDRAANTVFPVGAYFKGGEFGTQTSLPIPQAEENNPNVGGGTQAEICLDTNA